MAVILPSSSRHRGTLPRTRELVGSTRESMGLHIAWDECGGREERLCDRRQDVVASIGVDDPTVPAVTIPCLVLVGVGDLRHGSSTSRTLAQPLGRRRFVGDAEAPAQPVDGVLGLG
jgi:hypothetical protein